MTNQIYTKINFKKKKEENNFFTVRINVREVLRLLARRNFHILEKITQFVGITFQRFSEKSIIGKNFFPKRSINVTHLWEAYNFFSVKNDGFKIDLIDHDTIGFIEIRCKLGNMLIH